MAQQARKTAVTCKPPFHRGRNVPSRCINSADANSASELTCRQNLPHNSWVYVRQYCAEIDEAARNRMELIVRSLAEQNGVTEQLKAENQMEWVRQMNACKAQAEEVVKAELIYD